MTCYKKLDASRIERLNLHDKYIKSKGESGVKLVLCTYDEMQDFFSGYDVANFNLAKVDFMGVNCRGTNFSGCDLTDTEFVWSVFDKHTIFENCILKDSRFYEVYANGFNWTVVKKNGGFIQ